MDNRPTTIRVPSNLKLVVTSHAGNADYSPELRTALPKVCASFSENISLVSTPQSATLKPGRKLMVPFDPQEVAQRIMSGPTNQLTGSMTPTTTKPNWGSPKESSLTPDGTPRKANLAKPIKPSRFGLKPQGGDLDNKDGNEDFGQAVTNFTSNTTNEIPEPMSAKTPKSIPKKPYMTLTEFKNNAAAANKTPEKKTTQSKFVEKYKNIPRNSSGYIAKPPGILETHPFRFLVYNQNLGIEAFKKYILMVYKGLLYATNCLKTPSDRAVESRKIELSPKPAEKRNQKTLILDLDETLVHLCDMREKADVTLQATSDRGDVVNLPIRLRPYVQEFLEKMSKMFEVIVFTAGQDYYANAVIDYLDPDATMVSEVLCRDRCMETRNGFIIKDLRVIGNRDLKDMVIIDNLSHSFGVQIENGFPILEFRDDKNDVELKNLMGYLHEIAACDDVRTFNRDRLKLAELAKMNESQLFG